MTDSGKVRYQEFEGEVEHVDCPLCGPKTDRRLIFRDMNGVAFYQCVRCNIQFASPRFTEASLLAIYETEHWTDVDSYERWTYQDWLTRKDITYHLVQQNVRLLQKYLDPGASVLDVGCAVGLTVRHASELGFRAEGLEPSARISGIAREKVGATVHTSQIESFNPDRLYDGVLMLDVLEHLYDPVRVLRSCERLLKSGGYIFIHVPHHRGIGNTYKAWLCRLGIRKRFKHFGFPWHIYSFDKKSLTAMLGATGFTPVQFESWSHFLTEGKINILTRLPIWLARVMARSDYIVCIARKPG